MLKPSAQRNETETKQFQNSFENVLFQFHLDMRTALNDVILLYVVIRPHRDASVRQRSLALPSTVQSIIVRLRSLCCRSLSFFRSHRHETVPAYTPLSRKCVEAEDRRPTIFWDVRRPFSPSGWRALAGRPTGVWRDCTTGPPEDTATSWCNRMGFSDWTIR